MRPKTEGNNDITLLLKTLADGDQNALDALIPVVYTELKQQARRQLRKERKNHTLDSAALVNEAFLKLVGQRDVSWQNRAHFFGMSATLMRRILVNYARDRNRLKRGGSNVPLELDEALHAAETDTGVDLLNLDDALNDLARLDEQQARIVDLRYFGGLTIDETAAALSISASTVKREWKMAKAYLAVRLVNERSSE